MPRIDFRDLPDHGRLWVFPASRPLTQEESAGLLAEVDAFLDGWAAHGVPLRAGRDLIEDHFLLVGVDEDAEAPSGCSIDALVNRLRAVGESMGVELVRHAPVWFRRDGQVRVAARPDFRRLADEGQVDADTRVFDTSLTRISALRDGAFERPARDSWHGKAYFKAEVG